MKRIGRWSSQHMPVSILGKRVFSALPRCQKGAGTGEWLAKSHNQRSNSKKERSRPPGPTDSLPGPRETWCSISRRSRQNDHFHLWMSWEVDALGSRECSPPWEHLDSLNIHCNCESQIWISWSQLQRIHSPHSHLDGLLVSYLGSKELKVLGAGVKFGICLLSLIVCGPPF